MTAPPLRQEPHNLEAEQALLGAILINNEAYERVAGFLEPDHFRDPLHQEIFMTAGKMIAAGKLATPITLRTFFESAGTMDATTTAVAYLGKLATNAVTVLNARDYAQTIYDLAIRRNLILIGEDMVNAAYDAPVDFPPKEQIEEAEMRLFSLAEKGSQGGAEVSAAALMAATFKGIEQAYENRDNPIGLSTGSKDLDGKMGRLKPSDFIVLAGATSMGKTSLLMNILHKQTEPFHLFSQEMSREQVGMQLLAIETGISMERQEKGDLGEAEWRRLLEARAEIEKRPFKVDDSSGLSIAQVATRARRVKRKLGTKLIGVDYLQLMTGGSKRAENRTAEVTEITRGLKALAKELNVPVLALAQLSRAVDGREDKRPKLPDLRESGSIEQDADLVLFVFREEYYLERERQPEEKLQALLRDPEKRDKWLKWMADVERAKGKAEVIIAKRRRGPIGSVLLQFEEALTRFSDLAPTNSYARARQ
jgi:replicative DNA helicase